MDYYITKYRKFFQNFILVLIHIYPIIISSHIFFFKITQEIQEIGMTDDTNELIIQEIGMTGDLILKLPQLPMAAMGI